MKNIKKLTALILVLILAMSCLASCDFFKDDLQMDKYVANVRMVFATDDANMKAAIDIMSASSVLTVDGDNISVETNSVINDTSLQDSYTYVDGVVYHSTKITLDDKFAASFEKADMPAENRDALISKIGTGANITLSDFEVQEMTTSGDSNEYACSEITDEARESLQAVFASRFAGLDAVVQLNEAEYILETYKGRTSSSILSCHFTIIMNGKSFDVTVHTYYDYDYDAIINISAPQDADKYNTVSYEDIIG